MDAVSAYEQLWEGSPHNRDPTALLDREKPLILDNVKITPGTMIFKDAYDGKRFNQTLTITNIGKHSVTVRILPPTSQAFKIKPVKVGHVLSSGLSLTRKIRYLYTKPTAIPQACMDIYINNTCYRYELLVTSCYSHLSVTPKILDFGDIDVGMVSGQRCLILTNSGTKQAQYSIDLGRNPLKIIIQPLKGTVRPGESKKLKVEVFGTSEGEFQQEFWIKTEPLLRVHIQGNFIKPSLTVDYPWGYQNFLIISFPKTFVGVKQQKNVVIKNHSSAAAVFCVMGRTKDKKLPLIDVKREDINYEQFDINPMEGRLHSDQQYIMGITFLPQKPRNRPNYYICSLIVDVIKCRIGNTLPLKINYPEFQNVSVSILDSISVTTIGEHEEPEQEIQSLNDMITLLLYGEVEIPDVSLEPDKIYLNDLTVNESHSEQLRFLNNSKTLPLILKYNKVAYITMVPNTVYLPPQEIVNVTLLIKPAKMGEDKSNVIFDLFNQQDEDVHKVGTVNLEIYYSAKMVENQKLLNRRKPYFVPGITPLVTNEVGFLVDDVRFNTQIEKPRQAIVDKKFLAFDKTNDALVAFPNDRPKVLRPWRNSVPCNTIFAKLPRIITDYDKDYDLNSKEKLLKNTNDSYYANYIKHLSLKHPAKEVDESLEDYVTTNQKLILMQNLRNNIQCSPVGKKLTKQSLFVPLSPYELHNLIISPKFIQLGMLAAHTECSDHFNLENKNGYPVHVSIKALYPSITIHQDQFILGPNSQKNISFTYHSDNGGTHHIPMFVILNFFHVFDVTVLATIVSNTVKCMTKEIVIVPTKNTAFLEIRNPINSDVKFLIDTTFFHLESFPSSGVIPAKKNMVCTIMFNPEVGFVPVKEIAVVSESGAKELVEVRFCHKMAPVGISTENLVFENIPLNTEVSQELTIKNLSDQLVPVIIEIDNIELFPEISISPMRAVLWQKGDIVITFTLKFTEVVKFTLPVKITFQYEYCRKVMVSGNVVLPQVTFSPEMIKIQKIPSGAVVKTPFRVMNTVPVKTFMSFPLQDFPEFQIKTKNDGENVSSGITLGPNEKKDLYLEFQPNEPVAYCIYLPYILNGILGPPELNSPVSLKCTEYLNTVKNEYKSSLDLNLKLKVIKILCAAGKQWLRFSSLNINFCSFSQIQQDFEVTNISPITQEVTFKMSDSYFFEIIPDGDNVDILDQNNFKTILEPEETMKATIEFCATDYGTFQSLVSIYVKDYSDTALFNTLTLRGNNPEPLIATNLKSTGIEPKISPAKKVCYFLPTHVGSRLEKQLTLDLIAHKCNGNVSVECKAATQDIDIWYIRQEVVSPLKLVLRYNVVFSPTEDCNIETILRFSCPCNATTEMELYACGDSSLVVNFMSDPEIVEHSTYPLFPEATDTSEYGTLMHSVVPIMERWLYTQGFFYQNYYKIPDDISRFPIETEDKKKNMLGKKNAQQLPLVKLLINLMNSSILKYIDNNISPSQNLKERTLYNYVTYRNTIAFLKSQGIFVPGLKPFHLLQYAEYMELKSNFFDSEQIMNDDEFSEDEFYRFSKQKWLDLFFRIYKVLVLERVVEPKPVQLKSKVGEVAESEFLIADREEFEKYFKKKAKRFSNWFKCDAKLLLWLEYHYNRQKSILWPEEVFKGSQYFNDFSSINDGVALVTVTAAYCPYLQDHLKDTYAFPKKLEHRVHNVCKVIQAWKAIKLSFDVHPQLIVAGNRLKLLFIVTYLYEVLPHYYPTSDVTIETPLSGSTTYELSVTNYGDVPIRYAALFFGKGSELFELDHQDLLIQGNKTKKLRLTYFAKRLLQASAILVLSGEASGEKYAKSKAVTITGIPLTTECAAINIKVETYKEVKRKLSLETPYGKTYTAKIFLCFGDPKSPSDFHSVSAINSKSIPREVDITQDECNFVVKTETTIVLKMCFLSQGLLSFYIYFCNNEVGDFCVLVNITSKLSEDKATSLTVDLPEHFKQNCSCKKGFNMSCPKAFKVYIPCRNFLLWKGVNIMVKNCLSQSPFLQKYCGTPLVFRMLKFYLERFPEGFMLPSSIFDDQAEYIVTTEKGFSCPHTPLKIYDVTSEDSVPLVLHWNGSGIPNDSILKLKNHNDKEYRFYKLIFPKKTKSSISSKSSTRSSYGSNTK